ncbi:MAG: AraC family transcriptional regulator [Cyclobacteriaceae bacterium]|nr:MAG: AraC family transcriptional regulator [Cyclobacteriaceae bacterium]
MKSVRPSFEKISPPFGSSISVKRFSEPCSNRRPNWHFHPEVELVYVNGGSGKRHIGNHLSYFGNGELIFIGSNLPHYGFTDRLSGNKSETVVQMKPDLFGDTFLELAEMAEIDKLLERAKMGLSFHGTTRETLGSRIEKLLDHNPFDRLLEVLSIIQALAVSKEYSILNAQGLVLEISTQDNNKINKIYDFVRDNFTRSIALEEISDLVSMTEPAFCRYFKKISGKTFTRFVNEYRLVHASKLLAEKPFSITEICYQSGFSNFSHFNKKFKEFSGRNPSAYRKQFRHLVA